MAKIKGKTPVSKTAIKRAAATPKTKVVAKGDDAPDTKGTVAEQTAASKKLFEDADKAALAGFQPDLTVEQHENIARRNALGY